MSLKMQAIETLIQELTLHFGEGKSMIDEINDMLVIVLDDPHQEIIIPIDSINVLYEDAEDAEEKEEDEEEFPHDEHGNYDPLGNF